MTKPGRNDPCPCDSGKKYKKCCLAAEYTPPGREDAQRETALGNLLQFCKRHYREELNVAYLLFWGDHDPLVDSFSHEELNSVDINFMEWVVYDWKPYPESGKSLIDLYREKKRILSQDEVSMLQKMREAPLSLFEVQDIFPDRGLILKDLLLGGEYDVKEKLATRGLRQWDIMACRILQADGNLILSGSSYLFLIQGKEWILRKIKNAFKKYQKTFPQTTLREFLKSEGHLFNHLWMEIRSEMSVPKLVNTNGEPIVVSKATYRVQNKAGLEQWLLTLNEVERDEEDEFIWLDKPKDEERPTILGHFTISGDALTVETNSRERLKRAKKLIATAATNTVKHQADSFQDPFQAVASLRDNPPLSSDEEIPQELPPQDIQDELIKEYLDRHYQKWLTDKIPALKGKTPLEAVKTPAGKKRAIALLKLIENYEDQNRKRGKPAYDITWIWERLGLTRE